MAGMSQIDPKRTFADGLSRRTAMAKADIRLPALAQAAADLRR